MTFSIVIIACLLRLGSSHGNSLSFLASPGFVRVVGYEGAHSLNIDIKIRTWHEEGLLVFHKFSSGGHLKIRLTNGIVRVELLPERSELVLELYDVLVSDGEWHHLTLLITRESVRLRLDDVTSEQHLPQLIRTGPFYLVGGGLHGEVGFIGCVTDLSVDGERKVVREYERSSEEEVEVGECRLTNLCSLVRCQHGGICHQTPGSSGVFCDCHHTGYSGAVCQSSRHWRSCQQFLQFSGQSEGEVLIDPDGPGALEPVMVLCHIEDNDFVTSVSHSNPEPTKVDGFQTAGSFSQAILYSAPDRLVELLVSTAESCRQSLRYDCHQSGLLGRAEVWEPWGWWQSWAGERQNQWAGAAMGSGLCECGERGDCVEGWARCNCDSNLTQWSSDHGVITDKTLLPVTRLHFGDTGTPLDSKEGRFTLGPLACSHRIRGHRKGRVILGRVEGDSEHRDCPDISLELRLSSQPSGVLYQLVTSSQLCRLTLLTETDLVYQWGSLNLTVSLQGSSLTDGRWHSVDIEHNSLEVAVVVDREAVASHHHQNITRNTQDTHSYYLMDVDDEATSNLDIRMIEVNGVELSEYEDPSRAVEDVSLHHRKDNAAVPVEAVHAVTNNTIRKLFPIPNLIILISVLGLIVMFILLVTLGVVRYVDRAKSDTYYTQEVVVEVE